MPAVRNRISGGQPRRQGQGAPAAAQAQAGQGADQGQAAPVVAQGQVAPAQAQVQASPAPAQAQAGLISAQGQVAPVVAQGQAMPAPAQAHAGPIAAQDQVAPVVAQGQAAPAQAQDRAGLMAAQGQAVPDVAQAGALAADQGRDPLLVAGDGEHRPPDNQMLDEMEARLLQRLRAGRDGFQGLNQSSITRALFSIKPLVEKDFEVWLQSVSDAFYGAGLFSIYRLSAYPSDVLAAMADRAHYVRIPPEIMRLTWTALRASIGSETTAYATLATNSQQTNTITTYL